jgi:hypothetical protein
LIAGALVALSSPPFALGLAGVAAALVAGARPPLIGLGVLLTAGALAPTHLVLGGWLLVAAELAFDGHAAGADRALVGARVRQLALLALAALAATAACLALAGTAHQSTALVSGAAIAVGGLAVLLARLARVNRATGARWERSGR